MFKDHRGNVQGAIKAKYRLKNRAPNGGSCRKSALIARTKGEKQRGRNVQNQKHIKKEHGLFSYAGILPYGLMHCWSGRSLTLPRYPQF